MSPLKLFWRLPGRVIKCIVHYHYMIAKVLILYFLNFVATFYFALISLAFLIRGGGKGVSPPHTRPPTEFFAEGEKFFLPSNKNDLAHITQRTGEQNWNLTHVSIHLEALASSRRHSVIYRMPSQKIPSLKSCVVATTTTVTWIVH